MKKVLIIFTLFINFIHAATLTTNQRVYTPTDGLSIEVNFTKMTGKNKNWIAIYPAGKNNSWKNVIAWKWTGDKASGKIKLVDVSQRYKIKNGKYEVRAFYNNTYKVETKVAFEIKGENPRKAELKLPKKKYSTSETISVKFSNMINRNQDWIAIYPAASNNAWGNVIDWAWTDEKISGELTFDALPEGNYEVRAFYNNSAAVVYARVSFKVENDTPPITINIQDEILPKETVQASITGLSKVRRDWIGIYKKEDSNAWGNVLQWKWAKGENERMLYNFKALPSGDYEIRTFFNNSFTLEKLSSFKVILLEDEREEVLQLAKTQCQVNKKSTSSILCSNEKDIVYILTHKEDKNRNQFYGFYRVSIAINNEFVSILNRRSTPVYQHPRRSEYFSAKLENTPIYVTYSRTEEADERGVYSFRYKEKVVLNFPYVEREGILFNIKTYNNGQILKFEYKFIEVDTEAGHYTETYDISNPLKPKLINLVKKPLF